MALMQLIVKGSPPEAVAAAIKRNVSFAPTDFLGDNRTAGWCPLSDANRVLAWYEESGHGNLIVFSYKAGSLLSYQWPIEN